MKDKQIIIDGVDVSGCEDYKCDGTCASSAYHLFDYNIKYATCKNRTCYYKQLKQKEQKLAKIKEVVITHKEQRCKTCIYYDDCFDCDDVLLQIIEGEDNE